MITGARSEEVCYSLIAFLCFSCLALFCDVLQDAYIGGKKIAKLCLKVGCSSLCFRGFKTENMIASVGSLKPISLFISTASDFRLIAGFLFD